MTRNKSGSTVNQGGAPKPTADEAAAEFEIAGNVAEKGGKPSPSGRDRGETSGSETAARVDLQTHDRAS
jgi:hypothetical protein